MNSLNNTNHPSSPAAAKHGSALLRVATSIVVGSVLALASTLPVSAAPPTSSAKKTTASVKRTTKPTTRRSATAKRRSTASRSRTRVASATKPKSIVIHGYYNTHPYGRQVSAETPRVNVTVGRTTAQQPQRTRNSISGYKAPSTGGVIQNDGTVVPGPTSPGLPGNNIPAAGAGPLVTAPIGGYGPGVVPPIIVDTPPVVTGPVTPNAPVAPVTPPVTPTVP